MKILIGFFTTFLVSCLVSCNTKMYFDRFVGTWVPLDTNSYSIINRLQIEKRKDFYLVGAVDSISSDQPFFFVCNEEKNHLSFTPGQYNVEEYDNEYVLKQTSDIYYDKGLNCLFFLNAIYIPSGDKIFEISDNKITILPKE
jgi:hypothetical protein